MKKKNETNVEYVLKICHVIVKIVFKIYRIKCLSAKCNSISAGFSTLGRADVHCVWWASEPLPASKTEQLRMKWHWHVAKAATWQQIYVQPFLPSMNILWSSSNKISRKYLFIWLDFKLRICLISFPLKRGVSILNVCNKGFHFQW